MTNFMTCCQYQCNHARVYGEVSKQIRFLLIKPKRKLLKIYEEWLTISAASKARYQVWMNSENCSHLQLVCGTCNQGCIPHCNHALSKVRTSP